MQPLPELRPLGVAQQLGQDPAVDVAHCVWRQRRQVGQGHSLRHVVAVALQEEGEGEGKGGGGEEGGGR